MTIKKLNVKVKFGYNESDYPVYIGTPNSKSHPLYFQSSWLNDSKGGTISEGVMNGIEKLQQIAIENDLDFAELCEYSLSVADSYNEFTEKMEQGSDFGSMGFNAFDDDE